jgi:GTP-binding protein HflX
LTGMWTHLDRHGGGVGTRGPGETQIETDRRIVQKRLRFLKDKLDAIDRRKLREVKARKDQFCVCLVGYTNSGKSTMMNLLTGADTYVADKLFATLETRTRQWDMSRRQSVLLSDTVGFVRDLPHHLVASFRATLEEAIHADLLIHVADASNELVSHQIQAVEGVLDELGCDRTHGFLVLNKIDRVNDPTLLAGWRDQYPESLFVSAVTGEGTEALAQAVEERSSGGPVQARLQVNFRNGRLMQFIAQHGEIDDQQYDDQIVTITGTFSQKHLDQLPQFGDDVVQLDD